MSLRPRYSLLTLLILTALVAGGVKLWYGPHHVVLSDPPTREENRLLQPIDDWFGTFDANELAFRFEAERIRMGKEARTLALRLIPRQEMTIHRFDTQDLEGRLELIYPAVQQAWNSLLQGGIQLRSSERVVCLMHSGRLPAVESYNVHPPGGASPTIGLDPKFLDSIPKSSKLEIVYKPNVLFALTDQRQIYELEQYQPLGIRLRRVPLEQILDPELKAQSLRNWNRFLVRPDATGYKNKRNVPPPPLLFAHAPDPHGARRRWGEALAWAASCGGTDRGKQ